MNLYQPKNGLLSVNGVPYSKISSEGFAKIITMVPQNVYICRGTIQNNILLGKKMDSSIFENILDIAGLSKWLKTLPNGLQTEVEEGGSNISKGQRQRIGIARCLSQHTPFLLLDEFETGLPIEMANEILEHIRNDTSMERSIIWVSHSEDLLNKADDILNLSTGEKHVH
jgi:ABC-type transport system involved in cytochrome bd biosynthesis fused ATPase/permease subunit